MLQFCEGKWGNIRNTATRNTSCECVTAGKRIG